MSVLQREVAETACQLDAWLPPVAGVHGFEPSPGWFGIAFLSAPRAGYVTGALTDVDGGTTS